MLGNNIFPVSSPKFPLISIIPIISMESFQYGIFPKFPSLTYHGNLPETFRKFTGNFPPLCNPSQLSVLPFHELPFETGSEKNPKPLFILHFGL